MPHQQNTAGGDAINNRFPVKLLTAAFVLTVVTFVWFGWVIFDARRDAKTYGDESSRIEELWGVIVHLDEVLTMSARMAAATGESQWEERYRRFEPQLDAAIKEAIKLGTSPVSVKAATKTDESNARLVEMENRAFALVRAGRTEEARAVLLSPDYEAQKQIYTEGITSFIGQLKREFDETLREAQHFDLLSMIAAIIVGGISFVAWLSMMRGLRQWRAQLLDSLHRRAEAEGNLRKAHAELEVRVQARTAELANVNEALHGEIAERKHTEEQLRVQAKVLDAAANAILITDPNGSIQWVNPAFTTLTGYTASEVVGQNSRILKGGKQGEAFFQNLWQTISSGQVWSGELTNRRKDGSLYAEEMTITPVRNAEGAIARYIAIKQDVTARKRAEAELEEAHKRLLEISRQAGMAEVATSVLHNVGNVLNSVNISSNLVAESLRKSKIANLSKVVALMREHHADLGAFFTTDPKGKRLPDYLAQLAGHLVSEQSNNAKELQELTKNIEHIKDIVAMQQSYAKVSGVVETAQVTDLVEDALRMNAGGLERHGVRLVREYDAHLPSISVEKHKVLQILVNLMRNAKYACEESARADKVMTVRVNNGENRVRIAIIDNGVGISPENLTRIFSHGFTTRKEGHGFGLHSGALAAKEMHGSLTVHSDGTGRGATFTLALPLQPLKSIYEE